MDSLFGNGFINFFIPFFNTLCHLFLLWSSLSPSFYSLWALFVVLFQVPFNVKLHCLFELSVVSWYRPVKLWIFLPGWLSLCPTEFWAVVFTFSFVSRYLFISSLIYCGPIHCLVTCYLSFITLHIFQFFLVKRLGPMASHVSFTKHSKKN